MAPAVVETIQHINRAGLTPSYINASADGHYIPNDGRVVIRIKNTNAAARTAIAQTPGNSGSGQAIADQNANVPATTGDILMGPFPLSQFNDMQGRLYLSFSATAGVSFCPMRLPG